MKKYPKQVQFFVTEVCGEGCAYCPYTNMPVEERKTLLAKELSIEQWQKVARFLYEEMGIKLFTLIGGEPTVKKGLERLINFMNHNLPGVRIRLLTSGIPLLTNRDLEKKLIKAGLRTFVVSVDGVKEKPNLKIDLNKELASLKKGSERKSFLGLYFLLSLRKRYPGVSLQLVAHSIFNKETLDLILPTYHFLAKHQIYFSLCPEQAICFKCKSDTLLTARDKKRVAAIAKELVKLKQQPNDLFIPSKHYLESLPTSGIEQYYHRCSEETSPSTIHVTSSGQVPFCCWHRGKIKFNVMNWVNGQKSYHDWLNLWQNDKEGKKCSCSWQYTDRVNDYGGEGRFTNFWYLFV